MSAILFLLPLLVSSVPLPSTSPSVKLIPTLSNSVTESAKDLFEIVEKSVDQSANVIISPLSIHLAMSLLYNGVEGNSKEQLREVLGLVNISDATALKESRNLLLSYSELKSNLTTKIELANVIFADETFKIKNEYEKTLNHSFLTEVRQVDYSNGEESMETINDWVANKTNNLIEDLISPGSLTADTRLMLLNAVYFKANWQLPFQQADTTKSTFFVSKESSIDADMMFQVNEILYGQDKELQSQVVSLQYEDPNFTMIIMLPNNDSEAGMEFLHTNLKGKDFNKIHDSLNTRDLRLTMPKFKLGFKTQLVEAFRALGVSDIFDESADLSKMSNESLFVSDILHETKIEVNEEGSEAAAVTGIKIDTRVAGSGPLTLKINRPFMFVIQDLKNDIPLFMGKIVNPSDEDPISVQALSDDEDIKQNLIGERSDAPFALFQYDDDMDPEERAHIKNFPGYEVATDCNNKTSDNDSILFPCPNDTQPIEDYKKEHGDASKIG